MTQYYTHFIDDDPVLVYGPYELKSAKDFARIGSQPGKSGGGRRAVFTEPTADSRLVRVYEEGERVWPRTVAHLAALTQAEIPRVLAPKPKKGSTVKFAANPEGASLRRISPDEYMKMLRQGFAPQWVWVAPGKRGTKWRDKRGKVVTTTANPKTRTMSGYVFLANGDVVSMAAFKARKEQAAEATIVARAIRKADGWYVLLTKLPPSGGKKFSSLRGAHRTLGPFSKDDAFRLAGAMQ